jgi:hypothetical protein
MYKVINFNTEATNSKIGPNTKARITVKDGQVMIRFTDRESAANLSKDQLLKNLSVKGNGRRIGLPSAFSENLKVGESIALVPAKYGWFRVAQGETLANVVDGRVSV